MNGRVIAVAGLLMACVGTEASAQSYVRSECRALVQQRAFDDGQHGQWYRRFWTGDCGALLFCGPGSPNWNEVVATLRRRAPAGRAAEVNRRACILGQRIGHEWARDNSVRRIDTARLTTYVSTVEQAANVEAGLARVEADVNTRLGGR
jgi:hypothetical protein